MGKLSIIVPCYNEEKVLPLFYEEITNVLTQTALRELEHEIIFIDDGSSDSTLSLLKAFAGKNKTVRFVSFSRNFGKEAAIWAGLEASKGDYVALMDADMQDPPALLPEMYQAVTEESFDCAATYRTTRKGEPPVRSFFAKAFYKLINKISDSEMKDGARDYRLMRRAMVDAVLSMKERNRFSKGIFGWVGFRTKWIPFENVERAAGDTKWSFMKLLLYSIDGIIAFSSAPLAIASFLGVLLCAIAFVYMCVILIKTVLFGDAVGGWPSLMCVLLFLGGSQLFCMGILGQYLSRVYLEGKQRPIYIVRETEENNE